MRAENGVINTKRASTGGTITDGERKRGASTMIANDGGTSAEQGGETLKEPSHEVDMEESTLRQRTM